MADNSSRPAHSAASAAGQPVAVPSLHAGSTGAITIDLGQVARNWRTLADRVTPAMCGAVVKADAYGLGAARVLPALAHAGCKVFFVATPDEAIAARALLPKATLYGFDGLMGGAAGDIFQRHGIVPVLSTLDDVFAWSQMAKRGGAPLPCALHLDTGLNRLGLTAKAARQLAADSATLALIKPKLVMSHLASADNPRDAKNREQLVAFETLSALFRGVARSLAASDGLMLGPQFHFDLVRPGYALYGGQASESFPAPVKPAVTVTARILAIADVPPGDTVGYAATWRAKRASRIATIAAGYADGVPRGASAHDGRSGGHVAIAGHLVPIVGRVSMDLITVDVTDLPDGAARPGVPATLIGPGITIEQAGHAAGTIGYEILTRLGPRFARLYLNDEAG